MKTLIFALVTLMVCSPAIADHVITANVQGDFRFDTNSSVTTTGEDAWTWQGIEQGVRNIDGATQFAAGLGQASQMTMTYGQPQAGSGIHNAFIRERVGWRSVSEDGGVAQAVALELAGLGSAVWESDGQAAGGIEYRGAIAGDRAGAVAFGERVCALEGFSSTQTTASGMGDVQFTIDITRTPGGPVEDDILKPFDMICPWPGQPVGCGQGGLCFP